MSATEGTKKEKRTLRGFPNEKQRKVSTFAFVTKFVGILILSFMDSLRGIVAFFRSHMMNFFKKRRLEDVMARYRTYQERLRLMGERFSDSILSNNSFTTTFQKVEEMRRRYFKRDEERLIFGHEESKHRFQDFKKEFFDFLRKHRKGHQSAPEETTYSDTEESERDAS